MLWHRGWLCDSSLGCIWKKRAWSVVRPWYLVGLWSYVEWSVYGNVLDSLYIFLYLRLVSLKLVSTAISMFCQEHSSITVVGDH